MDFRGFKKISLVLGLSLMLGGCASYGPVNEANYDQLIHAALPPDAGAVKMSGKGAWCKDMNGFDHIMTAGFRQPIVPVNGVIVITETALYFLKWYKETGAYIILGQIKHARIQSLRLATFGRGKLIAVQEIGSVFYSFDFSKKGFVDKAKMEEALRLLQEMKNTSAPSATH